LTPRIIRQYERVRSILDKKLKDRDNFIEENANGEDPHRSRRDDLIRSLPDIKQLTESKPQTTVTIDEEAKDQGVSNTSGNPFSGTETATPPTGTGATTPSAPADSGLVAPPPPVDTGGQ